MAGYNVMLPIAPILHRAGGWFLTSGIQEPSGGVARYYRADIHENKFVSTEITGYAVSALLDLHAREGDQRLLAAAKDAGYFLARTAWDAEWRTFPCDVAQSGAQPKPYAYFFDCGMIVRGLLALWRTTRELNLLNIAEECGQSMRSDFATGTAGEYYPIVRLPDKQPLERERRWSRSSACYQLKPAMAWLDLADATADESFRASYDEVLAFAMRTHAAFLPGSDDEDQVMDRLHAYCYFLEGLLPRAAEPECAKVMRDGIALVSRMTREIGPRFLRADVVAQILRARLNADAAGVQLLDRLSAESEATQLAEFSARSADPRIHGGFWFGRREGVMVPHVSPVATAFGAQAIGMWEDYKAGRTKLVSASLV